jgi:hypothetical protein
MSLFCPGEEYLKRASVPSGPKKLDHNELDACEGVPESVLASVRGSGPREHGTDELILPRRGIFEACKRAERA